MTKANPVSEYNGNGPVLHLALELSAKTWMLGFTPGLGQKARRRTIAAGDPQAFEREVAAARKRFGLPAQTRVVSCYEAGRDGFWVHRWLQKRGVENRVVDSSSIEVNRRARRAKSDGLDVDSMLRMLVRYQLGEKKVFSVVRVPTPEEEDQRHLHRELKTFKRSRTRVSNRIRGLLATQGIRPGKISGGLEQQLEELRDWEGQPLRAGLRQRVRRACRQLEQIQQQIREIEQWRREQLRSSDEERIDGVRQLMKLRAVGCESAWVLEHEVFSWREIENGKQLGALVGLVPTPWQSGDSAAEQGISKAGIRWVRSVVVEMGWMWVRYQPGSDLTQWFLRRFAGAGKRARKVGIVALTRRLLIQLWHYRQYGVIPPGALLMGEKALPWQQAAEPALEK